MWVASPIALSAFRTYWYIQNACQRCESTWQFINASTSLDQHGNPFIKIPKQYSGALRVTCMLQLAWFRSVSSVMGGGESPNDTIHIGICILKCCPGSRIGFNVLSRAYSNHIQYSHPMNDRRWPVVGERRRIYLYCYHFYLLMIFYYYYQLWVWPFKYIIWMCQMVVIVTRSRMQRQIDFSLVYVPLIIMRSHFTYIYPDQTITFNIHEQNTHPTIDGV